MGGRAIGEPFEEHGAMCLDVVYPGTVTITTRDPDDPTNIDKATTVEVETDVHMIARLPLGVKVDTDSGEPTRAVTRLAVDPHSLALHAAVDWPGTVVAELAPAQLAAALRLEADRLWEEQGSVSEAKPLAGGGS